MVVDAVRSQTLPYSLQFVGLVLGIFGALLLTIPEYVLALLRCIFCCVKTELNAKLLTVWLIPSTSSISIKLGQFYTITLGILAIIYF